MAQPPPVALRFAVLGYPAIETCGLASASAQGNWWFSSVISNVAVPGFEAVFSHPEGAGGKLPYPPGHATIPRTRYPTSRVEGTVGYEITAVWSVHPGGGSNAKPGREKPN